MKIRLCLALLATLITSNLALAQDLTSAQNLNSDETAKSLQILSRAQPSIAFNQNTILQITDLTCTVDLLQIFQGFFEQQATICEGVANQKKFKIQQQDAVDLKQILSRYVPMKLNPGSQILTTKYFLIGYNQTTHRTMAAVGDADLE